MLVGDLNEVINVFEKFGGRQVWKKYIFLHQFLNDTRGLDLGFCGRQYTWTNGQQGMALIKEQLDIAVGNESWVTMFLKAMVEHLDMELSNHCPILLSTDGRILSTQRPFRFVKTWALDHSSFKVVENVWDKEWKIGHQLKRSLYTTSRALQRWNQDQFGFAQSKIKQLEEELGRIQDGEISKEMHIKADLRVHRAKLESILHQKSRETWLKEGDKNSKFFHMSITVRRH